MAPSANLVLWARSRVEEHVNALVVKQDQEATWEALYVSLALEASSRRVVVSASVAPTVLSPLEAPPCAPRVHVDLNLTQHVMPAFLVTVEPSRMDQAVWPVLPTNTLCLAPANARSVLLAPKSTPQATDVNSVRQETSLRLALNV